VGGFQGRAFTSEEAAKKFASTKSSIVEMPLYGDDTAVELYRGCILFFNKNSDDVKIQGYTFNNIDDKPRVTLGRGYGKYSFKLYLPLSIKEIRVHIPNILLYANAFFGTNDPWRTVLMLENSDFSENVVKIISGGDNDLARAILSS